MQNVNYQIGQKTDSTRSAGFYLYMIFLISYFLHLPARFPVLGAIRLDLLLMAAISILIVTGNKSPGSTTDEISKRLYILFGYIFVSLPFVEWPGSVIKTNIFTFIKAIVFFFFTAYTIRTEKDLKTFMMVFIFCQSFRIFEPVWLHVTTGYWGSSTHMGGWVMLDRLAGAPHDGINGNGLAWVIISTIPFMFFLTRHKSFKLRLVTYASFVIFIYALLLTQSRSGMIGLAVVIGGIIWKSKNKVIWTVLVLLVAVVVFARLDPLSQDRYLSIYRKDVKGGSTAQARIDGWIPGFRSVLNSPIVGHGLGTSTEVGANVIGHAQIAHNLFVEVLQELGIIGFVIFFMYIKSIFKSFFTVRKKIFEKFHNSKTFLIEMVDAMQVWVILSLIFSMASYGLSKSGWYLFGGLSAVLLRLSETN